MIYGLVQISVYAYLAEEEGFEPPVLLQTLVFKTSAFDHSAIPPQCGRRRYSTQNDE